MKLTFSWDGDEGHASGADEVRLMVEAAKGSRITVLDFLVDIRAEADRLYAKAGRVRYEGETG